MGWDSPNGAGHPFRVTPSRHSELHQGGVWSLTEFLHSRSLDFAPLQPLALVSPSVIKAWRVLQEPVCWHAERLLKAWHIVGVQCQFLSHFSYLLASDQCSAGSRCPKYVL